VVEARMCSFVIPFFKTGVGHIRSKIPGNEEEGYLFTEHISFEFIKGEEGCNALNFVTQQEPLHLLSRKFLLYFRHCYFK
jgi:hypothetical protein